MNYFCQFLVGPMVSYYTSRKTWIPIVPESQKLTFATPNLTIHFPDSDLAEYVHGGWGSNTIHTASTLCQHVLPKDGWDPPWWYQTRGHYKSHDRGHVAYMVSPPPCSIWPPQLIDYPLTTPWHMIDTGHWEITNILTLKLRRSCALRIILNCYIIIKF